MFILSRRCHSVAVELPGKYELDSNDINHTYGFCVNTIFLADNLVEF